MAKTREEEILELSEDIRLLAHWEPTKKRREAMCIRAADLLLELARKA
jgi:hypothetical protein